MKGLQSKKITIIGAGSAGILTALELAKHNLTSVIIEKNQEPLSGSALCNPGRIGLGFHYPDIETSFECLKNGIAFSLLYHDFFRKKNQGVIYFVSKNSMMPAVEIMEHFKKIQSKYAQLLYSSPIKEQELLISLYGTPEHFIKILSQSEYENFVYPDQVQLAIKVPEFSLDFPKFSHHLKEQILNNPYITFKNNCNVSSVEFNELNSPERYLIKIKENFTDDSDKVLYSDVIVNAAWEGAEYITQNLAPNSKKWTKRLKLLTSGIGMGHLPSMVFIYGPHCAITNVGNNVLYMTYEPATNLGSYDGIIRPEEYDQWFKQMTLEETANLFQNIKKPIGLNYVPGIEALKDFNYKIGCVKVPGTSEQNRIDDKESKIHKRTEHGVMIGPFNFIEANAMKLTHSVKTADLAVKSIFSFHEQEKID